MARGDQEPKSTFQMEPRADNGSLLAPSLNRDNSPSQDHKYTRRARQLLSLSAIGESLVDLVVAICCAYFIVFAALVYSRRNEPVTRKGNQTLLEAAKYVSAYFHWMQSLLFVGVLASHLLGAQKSASCA